MEKIFDNEEYSFYEDKDYQAHLGRAVWENFRKSGRNPATLFKENFKALMPYWDDTTKVLRNTDTYTDLLVALNEDRPSKDDFISVFWLVYVYQHYYNFDKPSDPELDSEFPMTNEDLDNGLHYYFKLNNKIYSVIFKRDKRYPIDISNKRASIPLVMYYEKADCYPNYKAVELRRFVEFKTHYDGGRLEFVTSIYSLNSHVVVALGGRA